MAIGGTRISMNSSALGSGTSNLWNQKRGLSTSFGGIHNINYHKKLKDEFDRYERFMREQTDHLDTT
jgi:hypothetical protein